MKNLKLIFALFLLLGIISCKKNKYENTSVKVTLIDENTQQSIPNRKITLYETKYDRGVFGYTTSYTTNILKEAYTDANGQVDFGEFETHSGRGYTYGVTEGFAYSGVSNVNKGESNNVIITVYPSVELAVKFLPPPPYNTGDSLTVAITNPKSPTTPFKITNNNYSQFPYIILSSGYYYINIDKYKSGIYTNTKDTVFYNPYSTNEYDVYW